MTNEEFLTEALASQDCPADFGETYGYFCGFQKIALDTLRAFVQVCDKNEINYVLAFGSLLGAIRDGGQIPWDYDVDVVVPYTDKDKLVAAMDADLDSGYRFCAPGRDPGYRPSFIRVVPQGYPHQMLHVDVFFAVGIPDDEPSRTGYCKDVRDRFRAHMFLVENLKEYPYSWKRKIKHVAMKEYYFIKYGKKAMGDNKDLFAKYPLENMKETIILSSTVGKIIYPSKVFLETAEHETRDGTFSIPADYETFFRIKYGDWEKYNPIGSRIAEVERHCADFRWYRDHDMIHV